MGHSSITYAIYNSYWRYGIDERLLQIGSINITPEQYEIYMYGFIFCPKCFTPLSRSPANKNVSKNTKSAHFKHLPSFKHIPCSYHTVQQEGLNYINDELAIEVEDDSQFKKVKEWAKLPPEDYMKEDKKITYQGINHDIYGEITEVPIPRHTGEKVKSGSNIETVQYICWNLDKLLNVGFSLPKKQARMLLKDLLYNTKLIKKNISEEPQLFYGKLKGFHKQIFRNRSKIQCSGSSFIYLFTKEDLDKRRGFNETCIGKYVMFFGTVCWDDYGKPYVMLNEWGAYAIIHQKFENVLKQVTSELILS